MVGTAEGTKDGASEGVMDGASDGTVDGASEGTEEGANVKSAADAASSEAVAPVLDAASAAACLLFCVTTIGTVTTTISPTRMAARIEMNFAVRAIVFL
jgi:hypothetical protein